MATVEQCRTALETLATALDGLDASVRGRHVPRRTVSCRIRDLGITFVGRLDEHGLHDMAQHDMAESGNGPADVRVTLSSDDLVALAEGRDDFLHAWLRGRVQISASMRDLLRLRSIFGV